MAAIKGDTQKSRSTPALQTIPATQSSFIGAMEYDQGNFTLTTHMKSGAIYQHKQVYPAEWEALKTAKNHSKQWADSIRGKKPSVRVKAHKAPNSEIKLGGKRK